MSHIEKLDELSRAAYMLFRQRMWPVHDSAGHWDVVGQKYVSNPHADLCPGTGLYAYVDAGEIYGIAGAYPMPVTVDDRLYAGHMLVDWAVLPGGRDGVVNDWKRKVVAAKLFNTVLELPGLKFASYGSPYSQIPLQRRAYRIAALMGAAIIRPVRAALLELFRLRSSAQACPACALPLLLKGVAESVPPGNLPTAAPRDRTGTAYVVRDAEFWRQYFESRVHHGAIALRLVHGRETAYVIMNLLEAGRFRFAILLAFHMRSPSPAGARGLGLSAREVMRRLGVSVLIATEADDVLRSFLRGVGLYVVRRPAHWWAIPKSSDPLTPQNLRWWLTSADRDAIWWPGQQTTPPAHTDDITASVMGMEKDSAPSINTQSSKFAHPSAH